MGLEDRSATPRFRHVSFAGVRADVRRETSVARALAVRRPERASRPRGAGGTEDEEFLSWVFSRAGLPRSAYRDGPLGRRLPACLRALRVPSIRQAQALLSREPALLERAMGALFLGVTGFFRDREVFGRLAEMLADPSREREGLRVRSVACSSGPELYSVAILLAELGLLQGSLLLGTDCRPEAIDQARSGLFEEAALRGLEERLRRTYFIEEGRRSRVHPVIRERIRFEVEDLLSMREEAAWDAVLCRNVAIYLEPAAARDLWAKLERALRPGGILVVGKAERPEGSSRLSREAPAIWRKADEEGEG